MCRLGPRPTRVLEGQTLSVLHHLHLVHVAALLLQLLLRQDATLGPEQHRREPGEEDAHHRQAERPGQEVVLLVGHPVAIVAAYAEDDHGDRAEEGCVIEINMLVFGKVCHKCKHYRTRTSAASATAWPESPCR